MKYLNLLSRITNSKIHKTAKVYPFGRIKNTEIESYSYVGLYSVINNCTIGKFCSISRNVKIGLGMHPTDRVSSSPLFYAPINPFGKRLQKASTFQEDKKVSIGNDVWIGAGAVILGGISIGNGAVVGANAVVTRNVEPYSIVGGVPAKIIRKRFDDEVIRELEKLGWWDWDDKKIFSRSVVELFSKPLELTSLEELQRL